MIIQSDCGSQDPGSQLLQILYAQLKVSAALFLRPVGVREIAPSMHERGGLVVPRRWYLEESTDILTSGGAIVARYIIGRRWWIAAARLIVARFLYLLQLLLSICTA